MKAWIQTFRILRIHLTRSLEIQSPQHALERSQTSEHIEDRRGISGGKLALGGLGGLGAIVVLLLAVLFGADPRQLLEQLPQTGEGASWFRSGFETGNVRMGDTFSAREL